MAIWLVPYLRGWSYDLTARALVKHLSNRYEFEIVYQDRLAQLHGRRLELVVDFWWKGGMHRRFGRHAVKQVSSHRWGQDRYGSLDVERLIAQHLVRSGGVLVPSLRLQGQLAAAPHVQLCPKGFHPETFGDYGMRRGDLTIGWAGAGEAPDKNLSMLVEAWSRLYVADRCLTQPEMPDFYNSLDVITCASDAEGDPRPLIEGMACGCFPVVTDVGIVPELVRHGDNGLIVERTPQAFAAAFQWCRDNLEYVRDAGRRNAIEMLASRTWAMVAPRWADAFDAAIARTGRVEYVQSQRAERITRMQEARRR